MTVRMELGERGYDILLERGCLKRAGELLSLDRKVLIVTDDGVPEEYAKNVAAACRTPVVATVPQGEASKSFPVLETLLSKMLSEGFTRSDCVAAVGGGVVGDLSGLAAALYTTARSVKICSMPGRTRRRRSWRRPAASPI